MRRQEAEHNLQVRLKQNAYPGRGIVVGRSDGGAWVQVYWIMGRSANSRNRVFVCEDGVLRTQAADPAKVEDPSLIIYNAMRRSGGRFVVSNGSQTDAICTGLEQGMSFAASLECWRHEPDAPNYTPRISACLDSRSGEVWFSIIKVSPFGAERSAQHFFRYQDLEPGCGLAITTYQGDGNPLPSFSGSPYLLPLRGGARAIAGELWEALDQDNRISLAVRHIEGEQVHMEIVNRYERAR